MCSRPFRPLGFAHLCRSRPRGSIHSLLPSQSGSWRIAHPISSFGRGECKKRSNLDKMLRARARKETDLRSTMKELINIIVQKTGISEENAQKAVQVMLGFLKTKLPAPVAAQLDSFLSARTPVVSPVAVGAKA